jgi:hypothetical protein
MVGTEHLENQVLVVIATKWLGSYEHASSIYKCRRGISLMISEIIHAALEDR